MNIESIFKTLLYSSFMGSLTLGVILIIKRMFKNKFNSAWHYYIWGLFILRLILPYSIESSFSIFNLMNHIPVNQISSEVSDNTFNSIIKGTEIKENYNSSQDTSINMKNKNEIYNKEEKPFNSEDFRNKDKPSLNYGVVSRIWLGGTVTLLMYLIAVDIRFKRGLYKKNNKADKELISILERAKEQMGIHSNIELIVNSILEGPALYGVFKPKILLYEGIANKLSQEEKSYVILHELSHLKRKDNLINIVVIFIKALHWFNPLVWYGFKAMERDRELACDELVLTSIKESEHKAYGKAIITLVENLTVNKSTTMVLGFIKNKGNIKERVKRIKGFNKKSLKWSLTALVILLIATVVLLTNGKGEDKAPKVEILATIEELSDEDYDGIGNGFKKQYPHTIIEDFRKVKLSLVVTHGNKINHRQIVMPELKEVINSLGEIGVDEDRYLFGKKSIQDNEGENFARYEQEAIVFLKDIGDYSVLQALNTRDISISWQQGKSKKTKAYKLTDYAKIIPPKRPFVFGIKGEVIYTAYDAESKNYSIKVKKEYGGARGIGELTLNAKDFMESKIALGDFIDIKVEYSKVDGSNKLLSLSKSIRKFEKFEGVVKQVQQDKGKFILTSKNSEGIIEDINLLVNEETYLLYTSFEALEESEKVRVVAYKDEEEYICAEVVKLAY